jgi:hypothetical protein
MTRFWNNLPQARIRTKYSKAKPLKSLWEQEKQGPKQDNQTWVWSGKTRA